MVSLFLLLAATAAAAPAMYHAPPSVAFQSTPLDLEVEVDDILDFGQIELYYRAAGDDDWRSAGFDRRFDAYVASIPAEAMRAPGVEYAILSRSDGGELQPRFASLAVPHVLYIEGDEASRRLVAQLEAYDFQRSYFEAGGGFRSYGAADTAPDYQMDAEVSYTYRVLSFLHAMRFGFGRTRALTWAEDDPTASLRAGFDRGFGELHFATKETYAVRLQAIVGADAQRFTLGGEAGLRLGRETSTHLWLWYQGVNGVGRSTGLALTWDTVPRVPMTATMEATSWPLDEVWAVRLAYEAGVRVGEHARLNGTISHQARSALGGGLGGELGLGWSF